MMSYVLDISSKVIYDEYDSVILHELHTLLIGSCDYILKCIMCKHILVIWYFQCN